MREIGKKVLGVIGGMGPLATQLFYKKIIKNTEASCDQEHLNMIILSHATMPDRTAAIKSCRVEELFNKLLQDAKYLEVGGADYLAIPCNTSHLLTSELQQHLKTKIINMIEEAVTYIYCKYGEGIKVGIMATDGTLEMELYQKECKKKNLLAVIPEKANQVKVMQLIYDGVKQGKGADLKDFSDIESEFKKKGCECVLLACTELSCLKEDLELPDYYIDAMDILAKKAIILCGKRIRE